jgi:hypothetical protein
MPLNRLLRKNAFDPEDIRVLTTAFATALDDLKVADRAGPIAELLASRIIWLAEHGERDFEQLRRRAIESLSARSHRERGGSGCKLR